MNKVAILYIPVLHEGYIKFFQKHKDCQTLYVLGPDLIKELTFLEEEIRALDPSLTIKMIKNLNFFPEIKILSKENIKELESMQIITANEEISKKLIEKYYHNRNVTLDDIFLRWDESSVSKKIAPKNVKTSKNPHDLEIMNQAIEESNKSSDWWRRVGAVVAKNGKIILKNHNHHVPSDHQPYAEGDPRDFVEAGSSPDLATAIHAEQAVVAHAARAGISLEGSAIYATVFPCPTCAKLVAYSGIKKYFYIYGQAWLDGERILKDNGVEIIKINL